MVTISGISKSFGGRTLFSDVSLQLNREDRVGLVGPNGAGKSTFFSLVLGQDDPDEGTINWQRGVTTGYLPQESAPAGEETVIELAISIHPEFLTLRRLVAGLDAGEDYTEASENAHQRFDDLGGHQIESKAKNILKGLGFRDSDFNRRAKELSGGWVMRAHLARLLVQEPDLLMLDEPTNHLDLHALIWFQEYLTTYPGAILMISHDREFLNALVTGIIDIRFGKLTRYRGTYDDYVIQRKAADEQQMAAYKNQQREIAHLMEFVERFRAKASKAAQAQSKLKQIERMEKIEAPPSEESEISFNFPQPMRSGQRVVSLKGVKQAYGNNVVYENLDFECERGQRIVLVGPNGAGKSTLLKLLAGTIKPIAGEHELGHNVKSGYYSQYRVEMLQPARTVLEEALDTPQRVTEQSVRSLLGCFLFRGDDVFKHIRVLSGGEKSRLALVKLLLDPPNLLLMDEPTTHLDMASIDALITALKQFSGTLIFISHDVYFIRGLANHVIHVNAGKLTPYSGDYQYYLDKTAATSERAALTSVKPGQTSLRAPQRQVQAVKPAMDRKEQKRLEAEQRQARSQGRKDAQKRVADLEKTVAALEAKQVELTAVLESPDTYNTPGAAQQANRELANVCDELKKRTAEWEAASEKLAEMDKAAENPGA